MTALFFAFAAAGFDALRDNIDTHDRCSSNRRRRTVFASRRSILSSLLQFHAFPYDALFFDTILSSFTIRFLR